MRGACHVCTAPKPASFGRTRFGSTLPLASNGRFSGVTGSAGLLNCSWVLRVSGRAWFGALNMSTRNWNVPAAAEADVARDRQVEHALEAAAQIAVARLQADAADQRALERAGVELLVGVAAAAVARVADDADARREVRRAGQVHVAAAVLVSLSTV